MIAVVKSDTCDWKTLFKEGKSVIKATFTRDGEDPKNATITIEGKNGKISFLVEIAEMIERSD
jgi:predicted amino acid dehydrogenase